tara:strand:+ start:375 stop:773 length:399 start_codon:yes stop_codon:yes gene_type:complete
MNDSVEERKKNRIKRGIEIALLSNPITGVATKVAKLLKGKLTPKKELDLNQLIKDLKSEKKLSKGDRGAAESMPKKEADFNVFLGNIRNAKPADMPKIQDDPRDNYPQFKAKGGEVKKAGRLAMRGYGAARK